MPQAPAQLPENTTKHFGGVPLRVILPNLVTLLALSLGLTSIRFAIELKFETAVQLIIAAAVLDALDGRIARALKGTSKFGAEFDSLADFVDFGVAPALLLYEFALHEIKGLGWLAVMTFAVAAALRLARFNVAVDDPNKPAWQSNFFVGMPAPAGAIVGMLPLYLSMLGLTHEHAYVPLEIGYTFLVALLMVSRIPHFSGKSIGRVPRDYVVLALFGVVVTLLLLATFPFEMLVVVSAVYVLMIPLSMRSFAAHSRADRIAEEKKQS